MTDEAYEKFLWESGELEPREPMPQTDPMSAEEFADRVWNGETGFSSFDDCLTACKERDRAILEAAAERVMVFYKSDCGEMDCGGCAEPGDRGDEVKLPCSHLAGLRKAILAPLNEKESPK